MLTVRKTAPTPLGDATIIRLTNDHGAWVELSSLGAGITVLGVADREGNIENIALNYADYASYFEDGPCMGKIPGRYANRIAKGIFLLGDKEYQLAVNNGPNHLHGGPTGFQNRLWECRELPNGVRFTYVSADGEEGYPGQLRVTADYIWSENDILDLYLRAVTDKDTVVNLTNHCYWNLRGAQSGSVLDQELRLNASRWLPTDETLIPVGEPAPVAGTPMDFTTAKPLGRDIRADFPALKYGKGYDNCFLLDGWKRNYLTEAATLHDPVSGRTLRLATTQPGVQVYTGNWLDGCPAGPDGYRYHDYDGVALECQGFPDAPNRPDFPDQILRPGQPYDQHIRFTFSCE